MELHEEIFQKISAGIFPECPENALLALSLLHPAESNESTDAQVRHYLSCNQFCQYICRAIGLLGVGCIDTIVTCYPETLYLVKHSVLQERLCVEVLSQIAVNPLESVDKRFAQLRVLLVNSAITEKLRATLRETIISVKDNIPWVTKLILLFQQEKLIDLIFQTQQPHMFWASYMNEFVSTKGTVSKKVLLHLFNQIIEAARIADYNRRWKLPGNTSENQKFMELCFSLNQNSATLLHERLPDLNFYVKLVNSGKIDFQWLFIPFRLLIEHHNVNILRSVVNLFNDVNWNSVQVINGADIIEAFITGPLLLILSKQLVYSKPSLGPSLSRTLLKLTRRYPNLARRLWTAAVDLGGNWTLKYHLLLVIVRSGSEKLVKLPLVDSISRLRTFMSTVPCVSEPLKGCIITAGVKCGLRSFDWSAGTLDHFIQFLSMFQTFEYHLEDFDDLKNDLTFVFHCIASNSNVVRNALHNDSVTSFYYQVWNHQLYTQLRPFFNLECLNLLILPNCRSLDSFWTLSNPDDEHENQNRAINSQIFCQYFTEFTSQCTEVRDFVSLEEVIKKFSWEVVKRNNHHLVIQIIRDCMDRCKLVSLILLPLLCSEHVKNMPENTTNGIDTSFIRQLFADPLNGARLQVNFSDQILENFKWKTLAALNVYMDKHNGRYNWLFSSLDINWDECLISAQKWLQSAPMFLVDSILKFLSCCPAVLRDSEVFSEIADLASDCVMGSRKASG